MIDMAGKQIIPAVVKYTSQLADTVNAVRSACPEADASAQTDLLVETSALLAEMKRALTHLIQVTDACVRMESREQAHAYHDQVVPAMEALRAPADKLEMIVDKELWPFPSYGDLMFEL